MLRRWEIPSSWISKQVSTSCCSYEEEEGSVHWILGIVVAQMKKYIMCHLAGSMMAKYGKLWSGVASSGRVKSGARCFALQWEYSSASAWYQEAHEVGRTWFGHRRVLLQELASRYPKRWVVIIELLQLWGTRISALTFGDSSSILIKLGRLPSTTFHVMWSWCGVVFYCNMCGKRD
jgi:hypothetical protein